MSVTVIATGFATHDGSDAAEQPAASSAAPADDFNILNGTFGSKAAPARKPAAPAAKPAAPAAQEDNDEDFVDIMSIFNHNSNK